MTWRSREENRFLSANTGGKLRENITREKRRGNGRWRGTRGEGPRGRQVIEREEDDLGGGNAMQPEHRSTHAHYGHLNTPTVFSNLHGQDVKVAVPSSHLFQIRPFSDCVLSLWSHLSTCMLYSYIIHTNMKSVSSKKKLHRPYGMGLFSLKPKWEKYCSDKSYVEPRENYKK